MTFRKRVFVAAGYNTTYFGPGRKEFNPKAPMPQLEDYLKETAKGTSAHCKNTDFDEGVISNFMAERFINQGNLPGFLPFMMPSLLHKPCTRVEGACGSGGLGLASGLRSVLSGLASNVFVCGFEIQNTMKALMGADVLAGAAYYKGMRKDGHAFFFPGVFSDRAKAYQDKYGKDLARDGMAHWYENAILHARHYPKAQEYTNSTPDLLSLGKTAPNSEAFVPHLNLFDCSKVSDGASSLVMASEDGLMRLGIDPKNAIEIVACAQAEGDITQHPSDLTVLSQTQAAAKAAYKQSGLKPSDIAVLEVHDCFSITGLLSLEALGFAEAGQASKLVASGETRANGTIPTNLSGGLCGFGHPTGATGVRQMVDLLEQLTHKAENQAKLKSPYGMMISMGGNDKTVTCLIVKAPHA